MSRCGSSRALVHELQHRRRGERFRHRADAEQRARRVDRRAGLDAAQIRSRAGRGRGRRGRCATAVPGACNSAMRRRTAESTSSGSVAIAPGLMPPGSSGIVAGSAVSVPARAPRGVMGNGSRSSIVGPTITSAESTVISTSESQGRLGRGGHRSMAMTSLHHVRLYGSGRCSRPLAGRVSTAPISTRSRLMSSRSRPNRLM